MIDKANKSAVEQAANIVYKQVYALDLSDGVIDGKDGKDDTDGIVKADIADIKDDTNVTMTYGYDGTVLTFTYKDAEKKYTATFNGIWTVEKDS